MCVGPGGFARVDGMDLFQDLFVAIVNTFEEMSLNLECSCNNDTSSKASSLLKLVTTFEFIVTLVISRSVLDRTLPVMKLSQSKDNDILDEIHLIESLKSLAAYMRREVDYFHDIWYTQALSLAKDVNVLEAKPRTCRRQINWSNLPADDVSEYYKRSITIPLIDHLNSELRDRFDTSTMVAYEGLCLIPSKLISLLDKHTKLNWKERFHCFANFYEDDLPNLLALDAELDLWEKYWVT